MAHHPTAPAPSDDLAAPEQTTTPTCPAHEAGPQPGGAHRSALATSLSALGQRRTFLVNTRSQLRAGLLTATCALVLLLLLNLSLYSSRRTATDNLLADSPQLGRVLNAQNRVEVALVITASVVFLVGVFVVTVLETHKTAGAAYNLARHMAEIEHGQYGTQVRLRKDDNLRDLEAAFNSMSATLQHRSWQEAEHLDGLARVAEHVAGPDEAQELARQLRTRAELIRNLAD